MAENNVMPIVKIGGNLYMLNSVTKTALITDAGQPGGVATLNENGELNQMPTLAQVGGSRPNLLINWYLKNPVNQSGLTTWTNGYTVDQWYVWIVGTGTAAVVSGGIKFTKTSGE